VDFGAKFARSRTPDARFFGSERITDSFKSFSDAMRFVQRTLAESSHFLCARHAEILKILHFFHANFAARCASSRFYTCAFLGFECISDPVNIFSDAMSTLADGLQILCARCGVCECSTHANQEMSSSKADVHSPVRSRPYRSKI